MKIFFIIFLILCVNSSFACEKTKRYIIASIDNLQFSEQAYIQNCPDEELELEYIRGRIAAYKDCLHVLTLEENEVSK